MYRIFFVLFFSFFLISCTHSKKIENLCLNYQNEKYEINSENIKVSDVKVQTYDIASFVREHNLYLKYDFKVMNERYKNLKSSYLKFKVLESLSSDLGFDNGILFNSYIKDDSNNQSELEVGVTGQGLNTNYYSSSNMVPNDVKVLENIKGAIQDQLFVIIGEKANENEINKLVKEFMVKGSCTDDQKNTEVIAENNFNDIHIILESNSDNFIKQDSSSFFSFNIR